MQFPVLPQRLDVARGDFLIKEFRQLVAQKGLQLVWEQAIECPCNIQSTTSYGLDLANVNDIDTNATGHNPDCPSCNGGGIVRHSPQNIQAIMTAAKGEEVISEYGTLKKEEVKFSFLPEHLVSHGDRLKITNSVVVWREITEVDANGLITTQKPIITRTLELVGGNRDVGVLYIHKTDTNGVSLGTVPDTDYQIDANGKIEFTNPATAPDPLTRAAVSYYANPSYVITSYPHTIRDTNIRKNQQEIPTPMLIQAFGRLEVD